MDDEGPTEDEEDLHDGVVDGDEVGEEVQVPGDGDYQGEELSLAGYSCGAPPDPDVGDEEVYCSQVGEVSRQAEYVHLIIILESEESPLDIILNITGIFGTSQLYPGDIRLSCSLETFA